LAAGRLKQDAAKTVGVSPQTISAWLRDPQFQASINALMWEQLNTARTSLQALARTATQTLGDVMQKADNYETRRRAALDILEMTGFSGDLEKFAMGVGPATAEGVEKEQERRAAQQAVIDRISSF
jgi:hypothetical protein